MNDSFAIQAALDLVPMIKKLGYLGVPLDEKSEGSSQSESDPCVDALCTAGTTRVAIIRGNWLDLLLYMLTLYPNKPFDRYNLKTCESLAPLIDLGAQITPFMIRDSILAQLRIPFMIYISDYAECKLVN